MEFSASCRRPAGIRRSFWTGTRRARNVAATTFASLRACRARQSCRDVVLTPQVWKKHPPPHRPRMLQVPHVQKPPLPRPLSPSTTSNRKMAYTKKIPMPAPTLPTPTLPTLPPTRIQRSLDLRMEYARSLCAHFVATAIGCTKRTSKGAPERVRYMTTTTATTTIAKSTRMPQVVHMRAHPTSHPTRPRIPLPPRTMMPPSLRQNACEHRHGSLICTMLPRQCLARRGAISQIVRRWSILHRPKFFVRRLGKARRSSRWRASFGALSRNQPTRWRFSTARICTPRCTGADFPASHGVACTPGERKARTRTKRRERTKNRWRTTTTPRTCGM
mmetsp:Transcript_15879/g.40340  ORF Transcript_15879/g.40340 Transcript_15879/m.40340 type:complete len:332 (+) Transcript_15879:362-1357(+)